MRRSRLAVPSAVVQWWVALRTSAAPPPVRMEGSVLSVGQPLSVGVHLALQEMRVRQVRWPTAQREPGSYWVVRSWGAPMYIGHDVRMSVWMALSGLLLMYILILFLFSQL